MKNKPLVLIAAAVAAVTVIGGGTALLLGRGEPQPAGPTAAKEKKDLYQCPMHPAVTSDRPGQCPICHMDLQKVDAEDAETAEATPEASKTPEGALHGRSSFSLSLQKQQLIGVATTVVGKRSLSDEVHATGKVAFDPDLFTAIEEYRQALKTQNQMQSSSYGDLRTQAEEMVSSARTKLRLMGLGNPQIDALAKQSGHTMDLLLPGGSVWVYAEVFEYEVSGLKPGQKVEVTSPANPGKVFTGKVASISPIVNSPTRTIRVRAQVPDPQGLLRPDTFVNVRVRVQYGERLAVPEDAVLHSGPNTFVFVAQGKGYFEPRAVNVGVRVNDFVEILSGLKEGESVVSAANFLIDSESRMKAALQNMKSEPNPGVTAPAGHAGH